jgi:hypothetical protein
LNSKREKWIISAAMVCYAAVVYTTIAHHEPWFDETHACIIAGTYTPWQLFTVYLRREGTPGLWHGLLWLFSAFHINFTIVRFIVGIVPCISAWLLLRLAPFPLWLRLILPFTFFLIYQYAVIARQYIFFPLFVFALAALAADKRFRPYPIALCAGLLANSSAYGFSYTVGFVIVLYHFRKRLPFASSAKAKPDLKGPAILLVALMTLALATAWPLHRSLSDQIAVTHVIANPSANAPVELYTDLSQGSEAPVNMNHVQAYVWRHMVRRTDMVTHHAIIWRALHALTALLSLLTFPIAKSPLLAFVLLILLLVRLRKQRALGLLIPYTLLLLICFTVRAVEHHVGMLFISLLTVLWLSSVIRTYDEHICESDGFAKPDPIRPTLFYTIGLVLVFQLNWGLHAVMNDVRGSYTGDKALAQYLRPRLATKTIAFGQYMDPRTPELYLANFRSWDISTKQPANIITLGDDYGTYATKLKSRPAFILEQEYLVGDDNLSNQLTPVSRLDSNELSMTSSRLISIAGYKETIRFCGESFMRRTYSRKICTIVYRAGEHPQTPSG